jgi:hypothetical protein
MSYASLVKLEKKTLDFPHFPTRQQLIVWRNWGLVPVSRIALVLGTTEDNVIELAKGMGMKVPILVDENWLQRGYITIIRANWHLLSYEQLLTLLDWSADKLAHTLKEDDFLDHKLGNFKPDVDEVFYTPLTAAQEERTREIRRILKRHFPADWAEPLEKPFGFLSDFDIEAAKMKASREAEPGEIVLDESWSIVSKVTTKRIDGFIERFTSNHRGKWGFLINQSKEAANNKNIILDIIPEEARFEESHTIEICDKQIYINAVDEVGLLRGLQWLEKSMDVREGPFLAKGKIIRDTRFDTRIVHAYSAVFGDPLLETDMDPYPEGLLEKLSKLGVNGIWLQGVLYTLVPWEEAPELSVNWKKRIEGLNKLIQKAAQYGIGVYLYINEPRAMSHAFFDKHPDWKGEVYGDYASLCTSVKAVQDYLRNSVKRLFEEAPDLAGLITITMSENITNCYSRTFAETTSCPRCSRREPQEVVAEVNRLIAEGAHSVKPSAKVICWTWGWQNLCGRENLWIQDTVNLLPDGVRVMCTSEEAIKTEIGGVKGDVLDYSMSIPGPGERAMENWKLASSRGLVSMAKVQLNNTWECSAVPYIPVPQLVAQHLKQLTDAGVTGLMLGWTLGGYPSLNLEIAFQFYWNQENTKIVDLIEIARSKFGSQVGQMVHDAWENFSRAFKEFPFNISVLYNAPQNFGPKNLLFSKATGFAATMVGYPYDDLEAWRGPYPEDVFENQFRILSETWKVGLDSLRDAEKMLDGEGLKSLKELKDVAEAAYCHFRSTYLQIAFVRLRNLLNSDLPARNRVEICMRIFSVIDEEIEIAKALYDIASRDSRIGYEASNHYFYTLQDLVEKVICCEYVRQEYQKEFGLN